MLLHGGRSRHSALWIESMYHLFNWIVHICITYTAISMLLFNRTVGSADICSIRLFVLFVYFVHLCFTNSINMNSCYIQVDLANKVSLSDQRWIQGQGHRGSSPIWNLIGLLKCPCPVIGCFGAHCWLNFKSLLVGFTKSISNTSSTMISAVVHTQLDSWSISESQQSNTYSVQARVFKYYK